MNIDAYYSRGSGGSSSPFTSPSMSSPYNVNTVRSYYDDLSAQQTTAQEIPQMANPYDNLSEADRMRVNTIMNSGNMNTPDMDTQNQRAQREISSAMYNELPRPPMGLVDRDTYNLLNQIYYRHYLNGTYGSPEMMQELQSTMDTIRQQRESVNRPMPSGTLGFSMGGYPGTQVVSMNQPAAKPTTPTAVDFEAKFREMLSSRAGAGRATPTIGGAGGLPGMR